jgi:hypothetical protein
VKGYGLEGRDLIPERARDFSLAHSVQTRAEADLASYPMGTEECSAGDKATAA